LKTRNNVHVLEPCDLKWEFRDSSAYYEIRVPGVNYCSTSKIDPFPAYAHDPARVDFHLSEVQASFPVGIPPHCFLLSHEEMGRTNGYADVAHDYDQKTGKSVPKPFIVLCAKRIPIMPAMTRYLVAHEYGHVVEYWIRRMEGGDKGPLERTESPMLQEYARMRDMPMQMIGRGGDWHSALTEVFANDFRILVANAEVEFWPHEVEHPHQVSCLRGWWERAVEKWAHRSLDKNGMRV
jgi:hypothetical protein